MRTQPRAPEDCPTLKGGTSPGPWTRGAAERRGVILRLSVHPGVLLFSIGFPMLFWIDFLRISSPYLGPKTHQNPRKIDAKMPSHLDFIVLSMFD